MFEKVELRQVPVTGCHIRKFDMSVMSFQVEPFCCPIFKKFAHKKKRETEQVPAKKRPFTLDDLNLS